MLDEAASRAKDAARRKPKPAKKRGRKVLKFTALLAAIGGTVSAVRALRPKQTARTGSSIPPKVRPVPTPSDDAVGGVPVTGGHQPPRPAD